MPQQKPDESLKPAWESSDMIEASHGINLPVLIQTDNGFFAVIASGTQYIEGELHLVFDTRRA